MKKAVQIGFGALFIVLGVMMLILVLRSGDHNGGGLQAALAPLGLISAGALAISAARRKPKKW